MSKIAPEINALSDVCEEFISQNRRRGHAVREKAKSVIDFAQSKWGMGMKLWPQQIFLLKCFYSMPLDDVDKNIVIRDRFGENEIGRFTESDFLKYLYDEGRCNVNSIEDKKFIELILVLGRRSSKTSLGTIIQLYETYKLLKFGNPQEHYKIKRGDTIGIVSVSTSEKQAGELFQSVIQGSDYSDYLRSHKVGKPSGGSVRFATDNEREVFGNRARGEIYLSCSGCSGKAVRGGNNIVNIFDELAHFIDQGRFSGSEVYEALTPSITAFGQDGKVLDLSSPGPKHGKFYDLYQLAWQQIDSKLMFRMPTTFMNPLVHSRVLKDKYEENPLTYMCEFDAEFSDRLHGWVQDEDMFMRCVASRGKNRAKSKTTYFMGIDLGLKEHGTGIAVSHREGDKYILDRAEVFYAGEGIYTNFDVIPIGEDEDTAKYGVPSIGMTIKSWCDEFPVRSGFFDQFNGYGLQNELKRLGLKQFRTENVSDKLNSEIYTLFKQLWMSLNVELYDSSVFIDELLELEEISLVSGRVKVTKPNRKGANDDVSDAIARSIWECFQANMGRRMLGERSGGITAKQLLARERTFAPRGWARRARINDGMLRSIYGR